MMMKIHGRSRKPAGKHDQVSESSEEMAAGEEKPPPTSPKRTLQSGEQSEPNRQRIDEGTTAVEERPEKITKSESSHVRRLLQVRSVQTIEKFLRTEHPRYHGDEEVDLDEFDEMEVEMEDYDEDFPDYEPDGEQEQASDLPTWLHSFEEGPPKLTDEELEKVDVVSRETEIDRLTKMKVLKELGPEADISSYKFLSTKVVYDWRHRENERRRRGRLVARECRWLSSYDTACLFSPTGVASAVKLLSGMFTSSDGYILGSIDVGDAYLMVEQDEPTVVEVDAK